MFLDHQPPRPQIIFAGVPARHARPWGPHPAEAIDARPPGSVWGPHPRVPIGPNAVAREAGHIVQAEQGRLIKLRRRQVR